MNAQRAVSTRLPVGLLERLCRWSAPDRWTQTTADGQPMAPLERLGVALHLSTIGVSMHPDPEVRVCDTLDWYAPRFLSRHTFAEIAGWFDDAGLTDVVDLARDQTLFHEGQGNGINIAGKRPANGTLAPAGQPVSHAARATGDEECPPVSTFAPRKIAVMSLC